MLLNGAVKSNIAHDVPLSLLRGSWSVCCFCIRRCFNHSLSVPMTLLEWIFSKIYPNIKVPMPSLDRQPVEAIVVAPQAPKQPATPMDKVKVCALAQQEFEGYIAPCSKYPTGTSSWRHKNPGNNKDVHGNFITFKTYEEGFAYLEDYIRRVALGNHRAYPKGGKTTIMEYTHIYTSDPEPSATNYAKAISTAVGLPTTAPMSFLLQ